MNDKARKVRHQLLQFYMKECRPPTVDELAAESGLNASDIHQILDQLEELHHIVKYKHESRSPTPIAMAHPFSHLPTPFVVFTIRDDQVACTGDGDKIDVKNCHAHFSIPPVKWWKDVRFACGTIQIFPSKQEALEWPKKYGFYTGEIMTLENLWLLSKAWYHDKHTYEYERKTPAEVETLFNQLGMSSEFWKSR
ncbi:hypothetical protein EYZ11_002610 [Aspergillus tanneri]|uniref:Uncharacterized protein n=1 Tax=Aspergillus tanneri TaxID=1220188 RepID=A0A4S3JQG9_9EURO|nr:hypothetical protein EYZ11_002610 [Aspergillus tanneri]